MSLKLGPIPERAPIKLNISLAPPFTKRLSIMRRFMSAPMARRRRSRKSQR